MGYARTALLLAAMTGLFLAVGFMLGGEGGLALAFGFALMMNAYAYWNSDKMVLSMYGARRIARDDMPWFHDMVAALASRAELPMPKVYIIEGDQPNAFATGRNPENAAVAATTGLIRNLTQDEVAGVMAHELAHIKNRDTLIMTITATLAGAISMLANFALFFGGNRNNPLGLIGTIAMMILAPMAAMLVQMAISRSREYEADALGAEICGQPDWLADALARLETGAKTIDNNAAERNPATAHMFIVNPLHTHGHDSLFSTHPATGNRIKRLREMTPRGYGASSARPSGSAAGRTASAPSGGQRRAPARRKPTRRAGGSVPSGGGRSGG